MTKRKIQQALKTIREICENQPYIEICGFLGYCKKLNKFIVQEEKNISEDPKSFFAIDPLNFLLFKDQYDLVAIFHSHIVGDATASEFDVKMSDNCCHSFLIYSLNTKSFNIYSPKSINSDVNILEKVKKQL